MQPIVESYLEKKRAETERDEKKRRDSYRRQILLKAGLYEKVFSPDRNYSEEFKFFDEKKKSYYKKVPIEVSDEEFAAIEAYEKDALHAAQNQPPIPLFRNVGEKLRLTAVALLFLGVLGSLVYGFVNLILGNFGSGVAVALIGSAASFVASLALFGFGIIVSNAEKK